MNLEALSRINVVGTSGCGKSTFSKRMAKALNIPCIEIDRLFWGPNWTYLSDEQLFEKLTVELSAARWVLDGNYSHTAPVKWKNVQIVIWLDYSYIRVMLQVIKRTIIRAFKQTELWEGTNNRESFKSIFTGKSMIAWSHKTFKANRVKYNAAMQNRNYKHILFVRLTNASEAERFLLNIRKS